MKPRVLVTRHVYPEAIELLEGSVVVDYHDSSEGLDDEAWRARAADVRGIVCQLTDPVHRARIEAAPHLEVIANVAVGYDNIDVAAATERGIVVTNTPGVLTESTADFAFALLMATARRVVEADRFLREGRWGEWQVDLLCGVDVSGATLGIVGSGRIGLAVARRARGFGMTLLYHSRSRLDREVEMSLALEFVPLNDLLERSDFVSLHVPLRAETQHLIGAPELARMKPGALLVNTARGSVVDEAALVEALQSGRLGGAGLDVFEREPAVPEALVALPQVVLAPHIASASVATRRKMCMMAAENAARVLQGEAPLHPVNEPA